MKIITTSLEYSKDNIADLCAFGTDEANVGLFVIPIGTRSDSLVVEDYSAIPCSLIVGTTGSGKSAFVRTLIVETMQKFTPDQMRVFVYDSRRVDYVILDSSPFLLSPVCFEPYKATAMIQWSLMEARKRLVNLDRIEEYPHLIIVFDDFAEMSPSADAISDLIAALQIARRTRIHYWLITSTPSSNTLPMDLKANINHRIAFRVTSKAISRAVLDDIGAETLSIPGEFIVKLNNSKLRCNSVDRKSTRLKPSVFRVSSLLN